MAFYVPLGPRGAIFRIGTLVIGFLGSMVYRKAQRRRRLAVTVSTLKTPTPASISLK